jgi:hypothetical protein
MVARQSKRRKKANMKTSGFATYRDTMKKLKLPLCRALFAGTVLLACASATAQSSITIDENGDVTSSSPFGPFLNATADLASFGLGYTGSVLSYAWSAVSSPLVPVQGFYNIYNGSVAPGNLIDVIQYLDDGPSYILDISTVSGSEAYDPTDISTVLANEEGGSWGRTVDLIEGMCGVTTVTAIGPNGLPTTDPGFMDDGGSPITYTFDTGSANCAPDGGTTVCLLGGSMLVLGVLRRRVLRA